METQDHCQLRLCEFLEVQLSPSLLPERDRKKSTFNFHGKKLQRKFRKHTSSLKTSILSFAITAVLSYLMSQLSFPLSKNVHNTTFHDNDDAYRITILLLELKKKHDHLM